MSWFFFSPHKGAAPGIQILDWGGGGGGGGNGVECFKGPFENLMTTGISPWEKNVQIQNNSTNSGVHPFPRARSQ